AVLPRRARRTRPRFACGNGGSPLNAVRRVLAFAPTRPGRSRAQDRPRRGVDGGERAPGLVFGVFYLGWRDASAQRAWRTSRRTCSRPGPWRLRAAPPVASNAPLPLSSERRPAIVEALTAT